MPDTELRLIRIDGDVSEYALIREDDDVKWTRVAGPLEGDS
jgi:hypothetical protein